MREKGQTEVAKALETPVFSRGIEILTEKLEFLLRIYHACLTKASLEKTDAAIPSQPGLGCI